MAFLQQKFREIVFQMLYSVDIGKSQPEDIQTLLMKELAVTKKTVRTAWERMELILANLKAIDSLIAKASQSYSFERIQSVERNILRIGVFELFFYDGSIPPKVAIAEAMRLSRKFGTPESANFVNAILDHLYKESLGQKSPVSQISKSIEALAESENLATEAAKQAKHDEQSS